MSILKRLVMLPLAPVEGVIWVAEQLERQASEQLYGSGAVLRELQELNAAFDRGALTDEEHAAREADLLDRLELALAEEEARS